MGTTYKIIGFYCGRRETLDTVDTREEAMRLCKEYIQAFEAGWIIYIEEVKE